MRVKFNKLADYNVTPYNYSTRVRQRAAKSLIRSKLEGDGMRVAVVFRNDLSVADSNFVLAVRYLRKNEDGWTSVRRENKKLYYDFRT